MSSNNASSIVVCDISCSIRAKSLCRPTLAAMAMMYSGPKTFAGTPSYSIDAAFRTASSVNPRSQKLNRKIFNQHMFVFDSATFGLQMRIDCGNSCSQGLIRWNEDNIRVVSRERFGVIDRGQRTTKRVVFNQPGGESSFAARKTSASGMPERSSAIDR
jgi:hypothetical protein